MASTDRQSDLRRRSRPALEALERRATLSAGGVAPVLTASDVRTILDRAAGATSSSDGIVAVVDRLGRPLGVRLESSVSTAITSSPERLTFAVDGALAKARSAAFYSTDASAISSRTMQFLSQSTIVQREVDSDPNVGDMNSPLQGPGFVAPVGKNGHFPPRIKFTTQVGPFEVEHTNRDGLVNPGPDGLKGTADDVALRSRFNADPAYVVGAGLPTPESYGVASGLYPNGASRGMGTLPGGLPIYLNHVLVGGIGVFYPGETGYATAENSDLNDAGLFDPLKTDRSLEAEYVGFVAVGGSRGAGLPMGRTAGLPPLPASFDLPFNRIDVNGVTLDLYGGHGLQGPRNLVAFGSTLGRGNPLDGVALPVDRTGDLYLDGEAAPSGWLVAPHGAADGSLSADDVAAIVRDGLRTASRARSNLRLPLSSSTRMNFAVTNRTGEVLGLYRMDDAPTGSIDEAVAKARNTAYYADPARLQAVDRVSNIPAGTAFSTRTFRYLAQPFFPEGIDTYPSGPFSILTETGVRTSGLPLPASTFQSAVGYDAFHAQTNFHDPTDPANQNGVVFWPGGLPLYLDAKATGGRVLVGGLGVGGDVPDVEDTVAALTAGARRPPASVGQADQILYRGVRLPYVKFARSPFVATAPASPRPIEPILPTGGVKGPNARTIRRILVFNRKAAAAARRAGGSS